MTTEVKQQKHTPGPWIVHPNWPTRVVPALDAKKKVGGAVDPDVEAASYCKIIASEEGDLYPEFHRSRVMPGEAEANARLIAAAPELLEALQELEFAAGKIAQLRAHTNACEYEHTEFCTCGRKEAADHLTRAFSQSRNAIAKATGGAL